MLKKFNFPREDLPSSRQPPVASFQAAFALPALPCAALELKANALAVRQERFVSNPQFVA